MKLGIVGKGVVGTAVYEGLQLLGHTVKIHSRSLGTNIKDLFNTEIIFICVGTPPMEMPKVVAPPAGQPVPRCDTSDVELVCQELEGYKGIVCIKSTVEIGTTDRLQCQYPELKICHSPEFCRTKTATDDFCGRNRLLVVGTDKKEIFDAVVRSHGHYPEMVKMVSRMEAEMIKYMFNCFITLRLCFADDFWQLCQNTGIDYTTVKNAVVRLHDIPSDYLTITEDRRANNEEICFDKDLSALLYIAQEARIDMKTLEACRAKYQK
jgi:UDPglucose 6-dehydrogenase